MLEGVWGVEGTSTKGKVRNKKERSNQTLPVSGGWRVCSGLAGALFATRGRAVRFVCVCTAPIRTCPKPPWEWPYISERQETQLGNKKCAEPV